MATVTYILVILYMIAFFPSVLCFIKMENVRGFSKPFFFISIWLIMPFFMIGRIFHKI